MRATEFLADLVQRLDAAELEYALVGSIAAMSFGEPRATLDIDVVIALESPDLDTVGRMFPAPNFYLSMDAARDAVASRRQFNVIHPASGMKVDFFVAGDEIERAQLERRLRRLILPGVEAWCSPPEELVVKKLSYYAQGGSDKHLRDVGSMLRISPGEIDLGRVRELARRTGLEGLLNTLVEA